MKHITFSSSFSPLLLTAFASVLESALGQRWGDCIDWEIKTSGGLWEIMVERGRSFLSAARPGLEGPQQRLFVRVAGALSPRSFCGDASAAFSVSLTCGKAQDTGSH